LEKTIEAGENEIAEDVQAGVIIRF
jgi:hypothetical protein